MRFHTVVALLSVAVLGVVTSLSVDDCPSNLPRNEYLKTFINKCYYFVVFETKEFKEAEATCKKTGGHLASVKSVDVNGFLWTALKYTYRVKQDAWIGLSDANEEGVYLWQDGTKMTYENFAPGTGPKTGTIDISNKLQDCVAITWDNGGKWKDIQCRGILLDNDKYFVCEYDPKPDPSA